MTLEELPNLRQCPQCQRTGEIDAGSPLWPENWSCPFCHYSPSRIEGMALLASSVKPEDIGMDPTTFDDLFAAERNHFWFRNRSHLITSLAQKFCSQAKSFLEIGCGNGGVLGAMAATRKWNRIAGAEFHIEGLRIAQKRLPTEVELFQIDARKILLENTFDIIGAFDVLEHIVEDQEVLKQIHRALTPQGYVILTVPQHPFLWSAFDEAARHVRRYRIGELEKKVRLAGFDILFSSSFLSLLLPIMVASRLLQKREKAEISQKSEFNISPWLNTIFNKITEMEIFLTQRGLSWPIGGSRILVGRRKS